MEQHPVPQNVTTFQFRLIGDMTIKQFGYLAGGAILAYISYKLPLPFFFTWPLTILFGVGGVGFAFVPIEERPMDIWVMSFLKNVYSPTYYVWEKATQQTQRVQQQPVARPTSQPMSSSTHAMNVPTQTAPQPQQPQYQQSQQQRSKAAIVGSVYNQPAQQPQQHTAMQQQVQQQRHQSPTSQKKGGLFDWFNTLFSPKVTHPQQASTMLQSAAHVANPSVTGMHMDMSMPPTVTAQPKQSQPSITEVQQQEAALQVKMDQLKHELENKSMTETRILELQKQLTEVLMQKDKMEAEVMMLRKQVATPHISPFTVAQQQPDPPLQQQPHVATPPIPRQPTVKIITPESAVKAGLPRLTTFPNVVTGIIKDSESNLLPGVLVTVKDKGGIPVRALKTNRLGQFAASTPLANGVYFVEIEDPRSRFSFDRVQITLNGSIVPALEIIAKSQREISRAKLAKEIFGETSSS